MQFNTNTVERGLFYQCMNVVLEVLLDDEMELEDYAHNFRRMFGDARMDVCLVMNVWMRLWLQLKARFVSMA